MHLQYFQTIKENKGRKLQNHIGTVVPRSPTPHIKTNSISGNPKVRILSVRILKQPECNHQYYMLCNPDCFTPGYCGILILRNPNIETYLLMLQYLNIWISGERCTTVFDYQRVKQSSENWVLETSTALASESDRFEFIAPMQKTEVYFNNYIPKRAHILFWQGLLGL